MARWIDADALKKEYHMADRCEDCARNSRDCQNGYSLTLMDVCSMLDDAPTIGSWISVKEVASIIANLYGDGCACNYNGIDEWLPQYCEYKDTDCPNPPGAACWEEYLKHLDKKPNEGG